MQLPPHSRFELASGQLAWATVVRERLPIPLKRGLKPVLGPVDDHWRRFLLWSELRRLGRAPPTRRSLRRLALGWSSAYVADADFLMLVAQHASGSQGPILECGSGASTLVAAAYGSHPSYSLEHIPGWAERVRDALQEGGLNATVFDSPLVERSTYDWYDIPTELPHGFWLVICDGPPGTTRGGRYGLLPELVDRVSGAVILLDDANRSGEKATLQRWRAEFGARVIEAGRHALVYVPAAGES
jgi:hypothetical protein